MRHVTLQTHSRFMTGGLTVVLMGNWANNQGSNSVNIHEKCRIVNTQCSVLWAWRWMCAADYQLNYVSKAHNGTRVCDVCILFGYLTAKILLRGCSGSVDDYTLAPV